MPSLAKDVLLLLCDTHLVANVNVLVPIHLGRLLQCSHANECGFFGADFAGCESCGQMDIAIVVLEQL
jgi:hypothetical protein